MKKAKRNRPPEASRQGKASVSSTAERGPAGSAAAAPRKFVWWPWLAGLAALFAVFQIYGPALHGAFVLDDRYLPFDDPTMLGRSLHAWAHGMRPLLMASFWMNARWTGVEPYGYHVTNVFLHFINAIVIALVAMRLIDLAAAKTGFREAAPRSLGIFAGALFLVHPLQTESVAYIASRSEVLSILFFYGAYCAFLYRRTESITWVRALAVVALFGAAVTTKEHTLALPFLLLLTDWYFIPGGLRANLRLYALLALAGVGGAAVVWRVLASADTAGFHVKGLTPATYFFTQTRMLWTYVRLFFLPFGQNADPDVAVSHSLLEHGAWIALAAWVAVLAAAWIYRKRWPLASFGVFVFLLLIAPTSSFIPIRDVLAERRLYLPFLGLTLICLELLWRLKLRRRAMIEAPVLLVLMLLTYQRAAVWGDPVTLWQDTVAKSPRKVRPRFQLAYAYYENNQCSDAAQNYQIAAQLAPPDYPLLVDWGLALDCENHSDEAIARLQQATTMEPHDAQAWALIGMVNGKRRRMDAALAALDHAQQVDPRFAATYLYRGGIYELLGNRATAIQQYQRVLQLDPGNESARQSIARVERSSAR
jgi:protein O-mannosyl-transferase